MPGKWQVGPGPTKEKELKGRKGAALEDPDVTHCLLSQSRFTGPRSNFLPPVRHIKFNFETWMNRPPCHGLHALERPPQKEADFWRALSYANSLARNNNARIILRDLLCLPEMIFRDTGQNSRAYWRGNQAERGHVFARDKGVSPFVIVILSVGNAKLYTSFNDRALFFVFFLFCFLYWRGWNWSPIKRKFHAVGEKNVQFISVSLSRFRVKTGTASLSNKSRKIHRIAGPRAKCPKKPRLINQPSAEQKTALYLSPLWLCTRNARE